MYLKLRFFNASSRFLFMHCNLRFLLMTVWHFSTLRAGQRMRGIIFVTQDTVNGTPVTHVEGDATWVAPGEIVQCDRIARFTAQRYVHLRNDLL